MNRRALLGTLATLAVAGCTGTAPDGSTGTTRTTASTTRTTTTRLADSVASRRFSWDSTISSTSQLEEPPAVSFPAADRVTVEGAFRYGSSSCDRIALREVTYADGTLDVHVVAASKEDAPTICTDDVAAGEYRVDVSLSNGLPAVVAVTEDGFESSETHTTTPS